MIPASLHPPVPAAAPELPWPARSLYTIWTADSARARRVALIALLAFVAIFGGLLAWRGASHQRAMPWDTVGILSMAGRIHSGQIPHTDFSMPVGAAPFWWIALAMRLAGPTADALAIASALALPLMAFWAWWLGRTRFASAPALLFAIFTALLFVGVQPLSGEWSAPSYAMLYNRMGWAWFGLLAVECCLAPQVGSTMRWLAGGFSTGAAGALLFFTKLNYTAGAIVVLGFTLVLYRQSPLRLCGLALGAATVFAAHTLVLGVSLGAYLHDQLSTAGGRGAQVVIFLFGAAANSQHEFVLLGIVLLFCGGLLSVSSPGAGARIPFAALLTPFVLVFAGLLIGSANMQHGDFPGFALAAFVVAEEVRRRTAGSLLPALAALASVAFFILPIGQDAGGILYSAAWKLRREPAASTAARVDTPSLRALLLPPFPGEVSRDDALAAIKRGVFTPFGYGVWLGDGLSLIERTVGDRPRVLCFDNFNPFPFALQAHGPKHDLWCWDFGRLATEGSIPPSPQLFADADVVMVPKYPLEPATTQRQLQIYGAALRTDFVLAGESDLWDLWRRR